MWIDTHVHLDAPEFDSDRAVVRETSRKAGVSLCLYPAVEVSNFAAVRALAHEYEDVYALGIHPLFSAHTGQSDLQSLEASLHELHGSDARLVAVGEIGLDFFVPHLNNDEAKAHQTWLFARQLALAQSYKLPVVVHSRKAVDEVIHEIRQHHSYGGIAHAFNGSLEQAKRLLSLGFKLGFGGAVTFERAQHLRRLVQTLPLAAFVLETDAPDMPPQWLYVEAQERAKGQAQGRNTSAELPAIAQLIAQLRGISVGTLAEQTRHNAAEALQLS